MKRILLLYVPQSQKALVDAIVKYTACDTFQITAFNVKNWTYNNNDRSLPWFYRQVRCLCRLPLMGDALLKFFAAGLLKEISRGYDAVDMTFFMPVYYKFADYLIRRNFPYKITFWGTDFYRANEHELQRKRKYVEQARMVQVATRAMRRDVLSIYPNIVNKIRVCNNGVDTLAIIDRNRQAPPLVPEAVGKVVLTLGYNGSQGQQHMLMLSRINSLRNSVKKQLHLFLPMTYGLSKNAYFRQIQSQLNSMGIPYTIFRHRLSDDELARLRLQTDIALNIQLTDALAASIAEHLYAGNVLVVGEWLPYKLFSDYGIQYYKTDVRNITELVTNIVGNIGPIKAAMAANLPGVTQLFSWASRAEPFRELFEELALAPRNEWF